MALPYKIATLLYVFNDAGEVLLMERRREPNRGLWSPSGGKLRLEEGESPYACACREAHEELGLEIVPQDLHLAGVISEHGYEGQAHWLMFLFEVGLRVNRLPPAGPEGHFAFYPVDQLATLALPQTDREKIWPFFWKYRGGFFSAHCRCHPDGFQEWTMEEAVDSRRPERTGDREGGA